MTISDQMALAAIFTLDRFLLTVDLPTMSTVCEVCLFPISDSFK